MQRTLSRAALGALAAIMLLAVACGGGGGTKPLSSDSYKDPAAFARTYYLTLLRIQAGTATASDFSNLFEDSCRGSVKTENLNKAIEKAKTEYPKLNGAKIDDIDFGNKVKVEKRNDGATVTIPSAKDIRIRIDGKWLNVLVYLTSVGIGEEGDPDEPTDEEFKFANNRYYLPDCDLLEAFDRQGAPEEPTPTPTPARGTATPVRATPTVTVANRTPTPSGTSRPGVSSNLSNSEVESFTKRYWLMVFGVYTGFLKPDDVLAFYTNDCKTGVRNADVQAGLDRVKTRFPKLTGEKLEEFDFQGKLKITPTSKGFQTDMPGARDLKIKVNGQWQDGYAYFRNAGLISASDSGNETSPQAFVLEGGKLYDADCVFLKDLTGR